MAMDDEGGVGGGGGGGRRGRRGEREVEARQRNGEKRIGLVQ